MMKSKKCRECDRDAFSKGFCQIHAPKKEIKTAKKGIKSRRESTTVKKVERSERRSVYFDYHIERCTHSEFSGITINEPTRTNVAHLIDKGRHPSLEDNLENYIYLTQTEHDRYDKLLFSLEFEKIEDEFKNMLELIRLRYKNLLPLCKENTNFTRALEKWIQTLK
jgi:hypothetical protein